MKKCIVVIVALWVYAHSHAQDIPCETQTDTLYYLSLVLGERHPWTDNLKSEDLRAVFVKDLKSYHIDTSDKDRLLCTFYTNSLYANFLLDRDASHFLSKCYPGLSMSVRDSVFNDLVKNVYKSYKSEYGTEKKFMDSDSVYRGRGILTIKKFVVAYYLEPFVEEDTHIRVSECQGDTFCRVARIIEIVPIEKEEEESIWKHILPSE